MLEIRPSARKHGIADADIKHSMNHAMSIDDRDNGTRLYLGSARNSELIEVAAIVRGDRRVIVIHAMKMRPKYRQLLPGE